MARQFIDMTPTEFQDKILEKMDSLIDAIESLDHTMRDNGAVEMGVLMGSIVSKLTDKE